MSAQEPSTSATSEEARGTRSTLGRRTVGRYEIVSQIGRGGMAVVYLARQSDLDRLVALKELSAFHAGSKEFSERFLRESRLAGSLSHPNIVTVHEYFEDSGIPYIAMEYVQRGSLRPWVGQLTLAQFAGVMEGVLAALDYSETEGVVHRDLKPENIMVDSDGRVKIADFGIAKATQGAGTAAFMTATGMTVGTPTYMAPEQAMAQTVGPWTDLYSVGVMAHEHLVGRAPFHDTEAPMVLLMRHVNEQIPSISELRPTVDRALSDWVDQLLVKDPAQRTAQAAVAWYELEEIVLRVLGARWRREARLPDRGPLADTPAPLTPAPFKPQDSEDAQDASDGAGSSVFLTYHSGPAPALDAGAAAQEKPAADEVASSPEPTSPAEPPPASEDEAPAHPNTPDVPDAGTPPAPVSTISPTFLTYASTATPARADGDPPAGAPADGAPADGAPPEEGTTAASEPAADASPTAQGESASADLTRAPIPRATPEAIAATSSQPSDQRTGRGGILMVAAVTGLVALAVGFLASSGKSGGSAARPALTKIVSVGPATFKVPATWTIQAGGQSTPGFSFTSAQELSFGEGLLIVASGTTASGSSRATFGASARAEQIVLGNHEYLRYKQFRPESSAAAENVYSLATTGGGVVYGICRPPAPDTSGFAYECERVLGSIALGGGVSAQSLAPSPSYASAVSAASVALGASDSAASTRLNRAHTAGGQATAADQLAAAYRSAAAAVRSAKPSASAEAANSALAAALDRVAGDYAALAGAARSNNGASFGSARTRVGQGLAEVGRAFAALHTLGYAT